jgi:hypothetical protein
MPGYSLNQLDQRTVAVEFPCCDDTRVVRGRARLVHGHSNGSAALHVMVHGVAEYFEFVFDLARFSGRIEHGERFACDFAIRLDDLSNPFVEGAGSRQPAAA